MLQGSLYETLTSNINRPFNFSYLTCEDIILTGGPSTFFFYFNVRTPRKLFLHHRAPFCTIICFVFLQISCFQIFFCVTHRVHFFLPHPVLLLFSILPHREYQLIFQYNIAFLAHRAQQLFLIVSHRANLPATSSHGGLSYCATLPCPKSRKAFKSNCHMLINLW